MSDQPGTRPLESIPTPIRMLLTQFREAPFNLAPERKKELACIIKEKSPQLTLDCITPKFIFEGGCGWVGSGIDISLAALESFWMLSYVVTAVHEQLAANKFQGLGKPDDVTIRLAQAARLRLGNDKHWEWPPDCPRPDYATAGHDLATKANWLFLASAGFAFLHELGHVVMNHPTAKETPAHIDFLCEFEADDWAFSWVMKECIEKGWPEEKLLGRSCCITGLFTLLAARRLCIPARDAKVTHPNVIDRLLRFLIKYVNEGSAINWEPLWKFPAYVLPFFMELNGKNPPNQQEKSLRDVVASYRPYLSNY